MGTWNPQKIWDEWLRNRSEAARAEQSGEKRIHNAMRSEHIVPGKPLVDAIIEGIIAREILLIIGPPGVGKTHAAVEVAAPWLLANRKIGHYIHLDGSRSLTSDELFDERLVVDTTSERLVSTVLSEVERFFRQKEQQKNKALLIPITGVGELSRAMEQWEDDDYCLIIIDECTRLSANFCDALLPVLNNRKIRIRGRDFYAPICVLLLGNPPGMDSSCVTFSHAFLSRVNRRYDLEHPGLDRLAAVTEQQLITIARRLKIADECIPSRDAIRLASAITLLSWGLPTTRKGMACLHPTSREFIIEVAKRDPELNYLLHELGKLIVFGLDARKPIRWLSLAMQEAQKDGKPFEMSAHMLRTAWVALGVGTKDGFTEGAEPLKQQRKLAIIEAVCELVLSREDLLPIIRTQRSLDALCGPLGAWMSLGENDFDRLNKALSEYSRDLRESHTADHGATTARCIRFLAEAINVIPAPKQPLAEAVLDLAERGSEPDDAFLLPAEWDGHQTFEFACEADRNLMQTLAGIGRDGAAADVLTKLCVLGDGGRRQVLFEEQWRRATAQTQVDFLQADVESLLENCEPVQRGVYREALPAVCQTLDKVLMAVNSRRNDPGRRATAIGNARKALMSSAAVVQEFVQQVLQKFLGRTDDELRQRLEGVLREGATP